MKNKFNILVATDYSREVMNAERYAVQFAKQTGSVLRFVHVFEPLLVGTTAAFDPEKIEYNPLQFEYDKLNKHVADLFRTLRISEGEVEYECTIREGLSVRKQVLNEVEDGGIDLVITGTHGMTALHELMFGSHTWDIIRHSDVPVLAVPEDALFTNIERIVFATEYREGEIPSIHYLARLAEIFDAELTVLHITNFALSKEFETMLFDQFKEETKSKVLYPKLNIQLLHDDHVVEGLNAYCEKSKTNWLVMSPHRISLMEKLLFPVGSRTTKQMSFHARQPMLVIPDYNNAGWAELVTPLV